MVYKPFQSRLCGGSEVLQLISFCADRTFSWCFVDLFWSNLLCRYDWWPVYLFLLSHVITESLFITAHADVFKSSLASQIYGLTAKKSIFLPLSVVKQSNWDRKQEADGDELTGLMDSFCLSWASCRQKAWRQQLPSLLPLPQEPISAHLKKCPL